MTLAGFRIRSDLMRIRIWPDPAFFLVADPDPRFDDLKLKNYLSLGLHRGRPATGEAFSPQKRTSSTSKYENSVLFCIFWGSSNSNECGSLRIWIRNPGLWTLSLDILRLERKKVLSPYIPYYSLFRLCQLARQPQWSCHRLRGSWRLLRSLSQQLWFRYDAGDSMKNSGVSKKRRCQVET